MRVIRVNAVVFLPGDGHGDIVTFCPVDRDANLGILERFVVPGAWPVVDRRVKLPLTDVAHQHPIVRSTVLIGCRDNERVFELGLEENQARLKHYDNGQVDRAENSEDLQDAQRLASTAREFVHHG